MYLLKVMIFHGELWMSCPQRLILFGDMIWTLFGISPTSRTSRTMASHHCSRWPSWFAEGLWLYLSCFFLRVHQNGGIPKKDRLEWNILWQMDDLWMPPRFRNSPVFIQMKSGSLWVSHEYCWNRGWRMDGCCKSDRHPKIAESWPNTLW